MGYVPMHPNETAIRYGSRMSEKGPMIHKVPSVQRVELEKIQKHNQRKEEKRQNFRYKKAKKKSVVEKEIFGKGQKFDATI